MTDQTHTSKLAYDAPAQAQATTATPGKLAYSVDEFIAAANISRTKAYEEIAAGRLRVRKVGARTIIRVEDAKAWLAALPESNTSDAA